MTTDTAADHLDDIVFWVVVGLAFLWVVAMAAEVTLQRLKPVLMFLVVAAIVGMIKPTVATERPAKRVFISQVATRSAKRLAVAVLTHPRPVV